MKCGTLEFSYLINQITTHTTSRISWTGSECKSNMLKGSLFWSLSPDSLWKFFEHTINKEKNIMACKNLPWGFVISHSNSREGSCVSDIGTRHCWGKLNRSEMIITALKRIDVNQSLSVINILFLTDIFYRTNNILRVNFRNKRLIEEDQKTTTESTIWSKNTVSS